MQTSTDLNYCTHCGDTITREIARLNGFSDMTFHVGCRDLLFRKNIFYDFQYRKSLFYSDNNFQRLNHRERVLYFETKGFDLEQEIKMYKDDKEKREMSLITLLNLKNSLGI